MFSGGKVVIWQLCGLLLTLGLLCKLFQVYHSTDYVLTNVPNIVLPVLEVEQPPSSPNPPPVELDDSYSSPVKLSINKSWTMERDRHLADTLAEEVRVLCWIAVTNESMDKARLVNETWGRRCTKLLLMGDESTKGQDGVISLDVKKGRDQLWPKTREAFKYIAENHFQDAEWFLKADTDTYVIMENLRYLLATQNRTKPHYFGCIIQLYISQGYMSGGAGYLLNQLSLRKLVVDGFKINTCYYGFREDEDASLGYCLSTVDVFPGDSRDEKGKNRFFPFPPYDHMSHEKPGVQYWYWSFSPNPGKKSFDCCSETVIAFHYISVNVFYAMEFLLYRTQMFGVTHSIQQQTAEIKS